MENRKIAVVIRWKTWKRKTMEKMVNRFGFVLHVSVNRRTEACIKEEDMPLLEECARRGIVEIQIVK